MDSMRTPSCFFDLLFPYSESNAAEAGAAQV